MPSFRDYTIKDDFHNNACINLLIYIYCLASVYVDQVKMLRVQNRDGAASFSVRPILLLPPAP